MLQFTVLVAVMASIALGRNVNFCIEEPFRQMQEFRDFDPAMERCAIHYAAQTITKTLPNVCLTTTKTVILATSTVQVTSHASCPTEEPHLDMRDEPAALERRDAAPAETTYYHTRTHEHTRTLHHTRTREQTRTRIRTHTHGGPKTTQTTTHHHTRTYDTTLTLDTTKTIDTTITNTKAPPHTPSHPHHSKQPREVMDEQRHAGPTPVAVFKRDVAATQTAAWSSYYAALAECGYDCIQTACSCVGTLKVELKTPAPTCTSTLTKETVVHQTKTIELPASHC